MQLWLTVVMVCVGFNAAHGQDYVSYGVFETLNIPSLPCYSSEGSDLSAVFKGGMAFNDIAPVPESVSTRMLLTVSLLALFSVAYRLRRLDPTPA